jgi:hypothetical protein
MKKLILLLLMLALGYLWLRYSNNPYTGEEPVVNASIYDINHTLQLGEELPVLTSAKVLYCASLGRAGYCVLSHQQERLLVLCRDIPPACDSEIHALIIPRSFLLLGHKRYVVAAMIDYMPVEELNNPEQSGNISAGDEAQRPAVH